MTSWSTLRTIEIKSGVRGSFDHRAVDWVNVFWPLYLDGLDSLKANQGLAENPLEIALLSTGPLTLTPSPPADAFSP